MRTSCACWRWSSRDRQWGHEDDHTHIIWFVANFANARGWGTGCKLTGRPSWDRQGLKFCVLLGASLTAGSNTGGPSQSPHASIDELRALIQTAMSTIRKTSRRREAATILKASGRTTGLRSPHTQASKYPLLNLIDYTIADTRGDGCSAGSTEAMDRQVGHCWSRECDEFATAG